MKKSWLAVMVVLSSFLACSPVSFAQTEQPQSEHFEPFTKEDFNVTSENEGGDSIHRDEIPFLEESQEEILSEEEAAFEEFHKDAMTQDEVPESVESEEEEPEKRM